ncbi:hypothetical protein BH10PSE13_BH10PSE13_04280 [soil metagenome]
MDMIDKSRVAVLSRRHALQWLGVGMMGGAVSACGGGGSGSGSGGSASGAGAGLVSLPTPTPTSVPTPAPTPAVAAIDESALKLWELAQRRGLMFGSPYVEYRFAPLPGPGGVGTLADFVRDQSSLYVNVGLIPQTVEWTAGYYNMSYFNDTLAATTAHGKMWRGHCLLYPLADSSSVQATVNAGNWRSMITRHFEAIAATPGAQSATNLDVTNEVMDPSDMAGTNGYRPNHWLAAAGPDYLLHAYQEARRLWPSTPLYWCHDQTEQLLGSWHQQMAAVNLRAIERVKNGGGSIDGYNMQGHLSIRLGFDPARLKAYLTDLTSNLGLKIMIGELDCRTGYSAIHTDTPTPESYVPADLDRTSADLVERFLDVALPFVQSSGRQLVCWGLSDVYDPWSTNQAERPMPWDENYQKRPMWSAIQRSLMRLPQL